jgi:hypothetical protein
MREPSTPPLDAPLNRGNSLEGAARVQRLPRELLTTATMGRPSESLSVINCRLSPKKCAAITGVLQSTSPSFLVVAVGKVAPCTFPKANKSRPLSFRIFRVVLPVWNSSFHLEFSRSTSPSGARDLANLLLAGLVAPLRKTPGRFECGNEPPPTRNSLPLAVSQPPEISTFFAARASFELFQAKSRVFHYHSPLENRPRSGVSPTQLSEFITEFRNGPHYAPG